MKCPFHSARVHTLSYNCRKSDGTLPTVEIGKFCSIGANCTFILAHHNPYLVSTTPSPRYSLFSHQQGNLSGFARGDIIIENDVWIGANVTILDNVRISSGAIIAAGAIITKDVPPYSIVGGNPGKIIKYRFNEEQIKALLQIRWWDREDIDKETDIFSNDIQSAELLNGT